MRRLMAILVALGICIAPASAQAFDTGPHADMTRDALTAEGFGAAGANVGMVNNWFVDYYTNPDDNPYSGHANALVGFLRFKLNHEDWLHQWVEGARRMHFDAERRQVPMPDLSNTAGVDKEWQRLMFLTRKWVQYAGRHNDPYAVMSVLGISLHSVQDFYAHSNWVEDPRPEDGRGGPGVASLGYGETPTWFDIPPAVRAQLTGNRAVYTGVKGIPRGHGHWQSNKNRNLTEGLNKDWNGRPKYQQAYVTAYFATRQWIRAVRNWLGNEPLWKRAQSLPNTPGLRHDVTGAEEISIFSGHWQGAGEPCLPFKCGDRTGNAGSVTSLRLALGDFHDIGPTRYRRAFNEYIGAYREYPTEPISMPDLPSTRTDQVFTRFVKLEVLNYRGIDLGDTPRLGRHLCQCPHGRAAVHVDGHQRRGLLQLRGLLCAVHVDPLRADLPAREHAGGDDDGAHRDRQQERGRHRRRRVSQYRASPLLARQAPLRRLRASRRRHLRGGPRRCHPQRPDDRGHQPRLDREEQGRHRRRLVPAWRDPRGERPDVHARPEHRPLARGLEARAGPHPA